MAIAGLAGVVPAGDDYVARKLRDLERQITELRSARVMAATTLPSPWSDKAPIGFQTYGAPGTVASPKTDGNAQTLVTLNFSPPAGMRWGAIIVSASAYGSCSGACQLSASVYIPSLTPADGVTVDGMAQFQNPNLSTIGSAGGFCHVSAQRTGYYVFDGVTRVNVPIGLNVAAQDATTGGGTSACHNLAGNIAAFALYLRADYS